jgi:hypothetical protein
MCAVIGWRRDSLVLQLACGSASPLTLYWYGPRASSLFLVRRPVAQRDSLTRARGG